MHILCGAYIAGVLSHESSYHVAGVRSLDWAVVTKDVEAG